MDRGGRVYNLLLTELCFSEVTTTVVFYMSMRIYVMILVVVLVP